LSQLPRQVKDDGDPVCFSDVKDTGIPALQDWCRSLTVASCERSARVFLNSIKTFATSVQSYLGTSKGITAADCQVLRDLYKTSLADDAEEKFEYGYLIPCAFNEALETDGLKQDGHGNVAGITAQLATVCSATVTMSVC